MRMTDLAVVARRTRAHAAAYFERRRPLRLDDSLDRWSPDDGASEETISVGDTLMQGRGYAEDTFRRLQGLEADVAKIMELLQK